MMVRCDTCISQCKMGKTNIRKPPIKPHQNKCFIEPEHTTCLGYQLLLKPTATKLRNTIFFTIPFQRSTNRSSALHSQIKYYQSSGLLNKSPFVFIEDPLPTHPVWLVGFHSAQLASTEGAFYILVGPSPFLLLQNQWLRFAAEQVEAAADDVGLGVWRSTRRPRPRPRRPWRKGLRSSTTSLPECGRIYGGTTCTMASTSRAPTSPSPTTAPPRSAWLRNPSASLRSQVRIEIYKLKGLRVSWKYRYAVEKLKSRYWK